MRQKMSSKSNRTHTTGGRIGFPLILKTETYWLFKYAIAQIPTHRQIQHETKKITTKQIINKISL